jgi:hypothetical protein
MDLSSVESLSGFINGGSGKFNLGEIDKSKSSAVSVLSLNNSSSDDLSAALEHFLELVLIQSKGQVSNNHVGGLFSLLLSLKLALEVVGSFLRLLLGLVSGDLDFYSSAHHFLVVEIHRFVDGLFGLELDKSSTLGRAIWVSEQLDK